VGNIHKRLKNVYGDDAVDHSTVIRWARRLCLYSGFSSHRQTTHPTNTRCAPSDYHLPGKLKEPLRGTRCEDDGVIITATKQWLRCAGPEFYRAGIQALVSRWHKAVERGGDYVEK
jgi:hypothetical protein